MTCPSELNLSMYADGELTSDDATAIETHLAVCAECRTRLGALRAEARSVAMALAHDENPVPVPAFVRPLSALGYAAAAASVVLSAALVAFARSLLDFSLPAAVAWLNPLEGGSFVDVTMRVSIFLAENGGSIMTSITETAAAVAVTSLLAWLVASIALGLRKSRRGHLLLCALVCAFVALPTPSQALEIRRGEEKHVLIPADETITDTLIALGETVEVDGNVTGDLVAFARRVVIRGHVGGQVFTAAENVTLEGEVDGGVLAFGRTLNVSPARIGRNLFGFGSTIDASEGTRIQENVVVFAERANLAGPVGHDVLGFCETLEVGSTVGGSLSAFANRVTLLAPARIAGDVRVRIPQPDNLTVSPGAEIGGAVTTDISTVHEEEESEYTTVGYYVVQVIWFAAAFVTGAILLALVPSLREVSLGRGASALIAGGVGLVTLVAVPVIAVLVAFTIIGIPVAALGLLLWIAGVYLAKVVLAHSIGARIVEATGRTRHFALALAVGLLVVMLVINLPWLGPLFNFVLTICGLGLLVMFVWRSFRGEPQYQPD